MWRRSLVTACVLVAVCSGAEAWASPVPPGPPGNTEPGSSHVAARPGRFDQGRMTVGLAGGGGQGVFQVAGNFGYFVMDRLRPGIALAYSYQDLDPGAVHTLGTTASLRYYLFEHEMVSPFALVEAGHIHMVLKGFLDDDFDYFSVAGGGGVFVVLGGAFGLEVTAGVIKYLGADSVLIDAEIVEEGVAFWWNVGFALVL